MIAKSLVLASVFGLSTSAFAATLVVNPAGGAGVYTKVQTAVNAAANGDIIQVAAGTYTGTIINTKGKTLVIESVQGAGSTILVGNGSSPVVTVPTGASSDVTLRGFTIQNANARGVRGTGGMVTIEDSILSGLGTTALNGGAVHVSGGALTVDNSTFSNNTGAYGAHVATQSGAVVTLSDSTFSNGLANRGGALSLAQGSAVITNSTFTANVATTWGGAIRNTQANDLTVTGCTFSGNDSSTAQGGAISSAGGGDLLVSASSFSDNDASTGGGAIYFEYGLLDIDSSTFELNDATAGSGGAVYIRYNTGATSLAVDGSRFDANTSTDKGGGIYAEGVGPVITGSELYDNIAEYGGGLYVVDSVGRGSSSVGTTIFQGNLASWIGGGLFIDSKSSTSLGSNTFLANDALIGAGANVKCYNSFDFRNNIVADQSNGSGLNLQRSSCTTYNVKYNAWDNNPSNVGGTAPAPSLADGTNLTATAPSFATYSNDLDWTNDDLTLGLASPLVDAGDATMLGLDNSRIDIGAHP